MRSKKNIFLLIGIIFVITTQAWARKPIKVSYSCDQVDDVEIYETQSGTKRDGGTVGYQVIMKTNNRESLLEGGKIVTFDECQRIIGETKAIWGEIN